MNNEAFLHGLVDELDKQATSKNVKARMAEAASNMGMRSPRKQYAHVRTRIRQLGADTGKMKRKPEEYLGGSRAAAANIAHARKEKKRSQELLGKIRRKAKLPG